LKALARRYEVGHTLILFWLDKHRRGRVDGGGQPRREGPRLRGEDCGSRAQSRAVDHGIGRFKKAWTTRSVSERREAVDRLRARGFTARQGCQAMNLPRSSYYRGDQPHRAQARAAFRAAVEAVCLGWPSYGYRRVTQELRRRGWHVNHKRVSRLMREEALTARRVKRFLATTDSDHSEPIFPNLARDFRPVGPNQLWVADITYIRLRSEFVFLAVILDAWSRMVVGYAVSRLLDTRLPLAALEAAIQSRAPQ